MTFTHSVHIGGSLVSGQVQITGLDSVNLHFGRNWGGQNNPISRTEAQEIVHLVREALKNLPKRKDYKDKTLHVKKSPTKGSYIIDKVVPSAKRQLFSE